jgi:hypothetical protein
MDEVILDKSLENKLYNLVFILYNKQYFSFIENAFDYVDKIIAFINIIPSQKHKTTYNKKFGTFYTSFKANANTTWYIIFDKKEDKYFINEITNNHCEDYAYVVSLIQ